MSFLKKTTCMMVLCLSQAVFFISKSYSNDQTFPTYSEFLKEFPSGYPKFFGIGNPKSIGAFKMYLQDLGYITFDYEGNSIGFKYYVSDFDESTNPSQSLKINRDEEYHNSIGKKLNPLSGVSNKIKTLTDNRDESESISLWVQEINLQIKNIIKYPKIAKDRNQSGRVLINISLMPNGKLLNVNIEETSGFKSLDQSAVNSINKIKNFNSAPFEAKNKIFTFILPIKYSLKD